MMCASLSSARILGLRTYAANMIAWFIAYVIPFHSTDSPVI